jgi:hypothetical protein
MEHKITVGLRDVKAVTFECLNCGGRLSVSPDKVRMPERCPSCDTSLGSQILEDKHFLNALAYLRAGERPLPFRILLEFFEDAPPLAHN